MTLKKILIISPHADDEVLGVGGTIARFAEEGHEVTVAIMTGHGEGPHPLWPRESWDKVRTEALMAHKILGVSRTLFEEMPAALVTDEPAYKVNRIVMDLISTVRPDTLFVPFIFDLHKDHRDIVYACSVAWRPVNEIGKSIREIYMYETLSETHWNIQPQEAGFLPNVFIDISGKHLKAKIDALACFQSQIRAFPDCRSLEAIEVLAKFRGCSVGLFAAEAFSLVREII